MEIANGKLVEYISGQVAEDFKIIDGLVSFRESSDIKWGAIGEVTNTNDRVRETFPIRYKIKILYNNGELTDTIIGANPENIRQLSATEEKQWRDYITKLIDDKKKEVAK